VICCGKNTCFPGRSRGWINKTSFSNDINSMQFGYILHAVIENLITKSACLSAN